MCHAIFVSLEWVFYNPVANMRAGNGAGVRSGRRMRAVTRKSANARAQLTEKKFDPA